MRLFTDEKLTLNTAFTWAVAFKHERNGGVADCFRTESGELCNQAWGAGSDTASDFGPSCS